MNRLRTFLGRFLLNPHMPILLTAFFWSTFFLTHGRRAQAYLFLAWLLTAEAWFFAAAWKKRELIRSIPYFIYFWLFHSVAAFCILDWLNRAFRIVGRNTLDTFSDLPWLILLFLIALRHRLLTHRRIPLLTFTFWFVFLFAWHISVVFTAANIFVRKAVFASVVTMDNPASTIMYFTTPTRMVALVPDRPDEMPRTVKVYSLEIPGNLRGQADTMLNLIDAAGAYACHDDQPRASTRLAWIAVEEHRLRDDHLPPVTVLYREWPNKPPTRLTDPPAFTRRVLLPPAATSE